MTFFLIIVVSKHIIIKNEKSLKCKAPKAVYSSGSTTDSKRSKKQFKGAADTQSLIQDMHYESYIANGLILCTKLSFLLEETFYCERDCNWNKI